MHQVLARKWRPKNFRELVGQHHVTQALTYALSHNRVHHAYLFTGTRGVGKTTIARIFAKSLNCLTNGVSPDPCGVCSHCREIDEGRFPDLLEVDAASRTGVDDTRELLENVPYAPMKGRYKVYLIDEVHMFSKSSFNALLKTLEEPPEHVKFILATTDPQKLPATILSRCLQFYLKNMRPAQIEQHLAHVLRQENLNFDQEGLALIAEGANGSMRDALSLLDQAIAYGQGQVIGAEVAPLLGMIPKTQIYRLLDYLSQGDAQKMRQQLMTMDELAPDYADVLKHILSIFQLITVEQLHAWQEDEYVDEAIIMLAERLPVELMQLWYQIASDTWQVMPYQADSRVVLEMMLLRMLALQPILPTAQTLSPAPILEQPQAQAVVTQLPEHNPPESPPDEMMRNEADEAMVLDDLPEMQDSVAIPPPAQEEREEYLPEVTPTAVQEKTVLAEFDLPSMINNALGWAKYWNETQEINDLSLRHFALNVLPISFDGQTLTLASDKNFAHNKQALEKLQIMLAQFCKKDIVIQMVVQDGFIPPATQLVQEKARYKNAQQQQFLDHPAVVQLVVAGGVIDRNTIQKEE